MVGHALGLGVGAVGGVPLAQGGLGLGNGGLEVVAVLDVAQDGLHVLTLALEGNGLGVAPDGLDALAAQALVHTVGGHAQADAHVNQGVGCVLGHVVGDAGAGDVGVAGALHALVVGAVGAALGLGIGGGDAAVGGQAEVGAVGAGGVVAVGAGVVGGAVGVEDDQAALLDGLGDVVDGGIGHGVAHAGAAGGAVEILPHGLIVGGIAGEGAVRVGGVGLPVGLDQTDLGGAGAAAPGVVEGLQHGLGFFLGPGDLGGAGIIDGVVQFSFHAGVVAAGHTGGGLPDQEVAVLLQGARDVGVGGLDGLDDLRLDADVVLLGHLADAAHGGGSAGLDRFDLGEYVRVEDGVVFLRDGAIQPALAGDGGSCGRGKGGQKARDHCQHDQECEEAFELFTHV